MADAGRLSASGLRSAPSDVLDLESQLPEHFNGAASAASRIRRSQAKRLTSGEPVGHAQDRLRVILAVAIDQHDRPRPAEPVLREETVLTQPVETPQSRALRRRASPGPDHHPPSVRPPDDWNS